MLNNKKAAMVLPLAMLGILLGLGFYYVYQSAEPSFTFTIGEKGLTLIEASRKAQNTFTYIQTSADQSIKESIFEISENGMNIAVTRCGTYFGYSVWNTKDMNCYPSERAVKNSIILSFKDRFNRDIENFPEKSIPLDNYDYFIDDQDNLALYGIAFRDYKLKINATPRRGLGSVKTDFKVENTDRATGAVVVRTPTLGPINVSPKGIVGEYSIKPSFKTELESNIIEDYKKVKELVRFTLFEEVRKCEDTANPPELDTCLEVTISKLNAPPTSDFKWSRNCDSIDENLDDRTIPICVETGESYFVFDEDQDKVVDKPVTIKFALYFPET